MCTHFNAGLELGLELEVGARGEGGGLGCLIQEPNDEIASARSLSEPDLHSSESSFTLSLLLRVAACVGVLYPLVCWALLFRVAFPPLSSFPSCLSASLFFSE